MRVTRPHGQVASAFSKTVLGQRIGVGRVNAHILVSREEASVATGGEHGLRMCKPLPFSRRSRSQIRYRDAQALIGPRRSLRVDSLPGSFSRRSKEAFRSELIIAFLSSNQDRYSPATQR